MGSAHVGWAIVIGSALAAGVRGAADDAPPVATTRAAADLPSAFKAALERWRERQEHPETYAKGVYPLSFEADAAEVARAGRSDPAAAAAFLAKRLREGDRATGALALASLGARGDDAAVKAVLGLAIDPNNWRDELAVLALASAPTEAARPALERLVRERRSAEAARLLAGVGDAGSLAMLRAFTRADAERVNRSGIDEFVAAQADAVAQLERMLKADPARRQAMARQWLAFRQVIDYPTNYHVPHMDYEAAAEALRRSGVKFDDDFLQDRLRGLEAPDGYRQFEAFVVKEMLGP